MCCLILTRAVAALPNASAAFELLTCMKYAQRGQNETVCSAGRDSCDGVLQLLMKSSH